MQFEFGMQTDHDS